MKHVQPPLQPAVSQRILAPEMLIGAIREARLDPCQLTSGPAPSVLQRVILPRVCLDLARLGPALWFTGEMPADAFTLVYVTACPVPGRSFNFGMEHVDGYLGLFPPRGVVDAVTPCGYGNASLTVPSDVFHAELDDRFPEIPDSARLRGAGMRVGEREIARLQQLLEEVEQLIADPAAPLASPAARMTLERELLDCFLGALCSGCGSKSSMGRVRLKRRYDRLRKARDLLLGRAGAPLPLDDLCAELRLSRRGLETMFGECMGVSPARLLRHRRLHLVRVALREVVEPQAGAIKQQALEHGFWHLGRFARDYRLLFGESPSETLRRR